LPGNISRVKNWDAIEKGVFRGEHNDRS
jgi:hypothetical protein